MDGIFYYEIETKRKLILKRFILLGKYFIHKCKWTRKTQREQEFKTEINPHFKTLRTDGAKSCNTLGIMMRISLSLHIVHKSIRLLLVIYFILLMLLFPSLFV